ncbi:MAG: prolipoprotein diacylglyceryl transferase [Bacteroidota bacterium]
MYPKLFTIGPFTVYSFGLMLGLGFIAANLVLTHEMNRKNLDANAAGTITLFAVIFGIAGSKLLYLFENWSSFIQAPISMAFSPGGLTWYGGFTLATGMIYLYTRKKSIPFLKVADAASPAIAIAYGIARIGCHLSGDGDYGIPTNLPWGAVYSKGTYPPSAAFREVPELVKKYGVNGVVPDTISVHPVPVYEFIIGVAIFLFLWNMRKHELPDGKLFVIFLILSGFARFLVEFIRINPRVMFGLSEAQLLSLVMILIGIAGYYVLGKKPAKQTVMVN